MSADQRVADRADVGEPVLRRWWRRLPDQLDRRVVVAAWVSFAVQVLLVATGGAVRLTSSASADAASTVRPVRACTAAGV